jgi:hypothetical protein
MPGSDGQRLGGLAIAALPECRRAQEYSTQQMPIDRSFRYLAAVSDRAATFCFDSLCMEQLRSARERGIMQAA